jgi:hypothetical protein
VLFSISSNQSLFNISKRAFFFPPPTPQHTQVANAASDATKKHPKAVGATGVTVDAAGGGGAAKGGKKAAGGGGLSREDEAL